MAYENIRLRKQNLTVIDGYFWTFDEDVDSLIVKTDDGTTAFSYPLDNTLSNPIKSLEYDGRNFWTLETAGTNSLTIKRWYLKNYVCVLRNTFNLVAGASHNFNSNAFTVEHYHTQFRTDEDVHQNVLNIQDGSRIESGYTIVLGPNDDGIVEEFSVASATSNTVNINGYTDYAYKANDPISFYKNIWLFNNFNGTDGSTGALYKIDAYTGSVVSKLAGGTYKDVLACTFFDVPNYVFVPSTENPPPTTPKFNSIAYTKGTNMIFLNPEDLNNSNGSMTMDNIEDNQATTIPIYDIAIEGTNVYRLQLKATYYGNTYEFDDDTYNHQLSTLNSFITSISLRAEPAILPANPSNNSTITAIVRDQFNLPVKQRSVYFTDDDPNGSILATNVTTNDDGIAVTTYRAGTSAREVRITATAQQS
jgi:hypothetical protein